MGRRKNMCPNPECPKHGEPTGVMGGCDCGAPLIPLKVEPTDEQLERTMIAMGVPANVAVTMTMLPNLRQGALEFHALVQKAMNGDRSAHARLDSIRKHFADKGSAYDVF